MPLWPDVITKPMPYYRLRTFTLSGLIVAVILTMLPVNVCYAGFRILDQPLWIFPGQNFRIALEQPYGSGQPMVTFSKNVEMYDTWDKDRVQRFYFRATDAGKANLQFQGAAGLLDMPVEIIPWAAIYQPRSHEGIQLPRIWPLGKTDFSKIKNLRTLHTDSDIHRMRLKHSKPGPIAQRWVRMSDMAVYNIIPGPTVPRAPLMTVSSDYDKGRGKGCPVCGKAIYVGRDGFYPWRFDPVKHPWKVGCPSCGTWFPSNDWHTGDMHSGPFPDDGFGCEPVESVHSGSGETWRWPFIAYYHEWQAYMNYTTGISECAEAFIQTNDKRYAHKAAIGLFRLAESWLDLSLNLNHRKTAALAGIMRGPVGAPNSQTRLLANSFSYIQPNWDTPRMEEAAYAWDLIFDQLEENKELLNFCRSQHHPELKITQDFRRFIEAGIIRTPIQFAMDKAVSRNWPMQESLLLTMALALGMPESLDIVDYVLNGDGGIRYALTNEFFKDGAGHESGGYNGIQVRGMEKIVGLLERLAGFFPGHYKPPRFISIVDNPKYRQIYEFPLQTTLIGRSTPATGDDGFRAGTKPLPPMQGYPLKVNDFANVFRRTKGLQFAQVLFGPTGSIPSGLGDEDMEQINRTGRQRGWQVNLGSNILDGYGYAILRSGKNDRQRAMWLYYGKALQHSHQDMLTYGIEALQRKMLPELGYPVGWAYADDWEANWGTHYGTHITGVKSSSFGRGSLQTFVDGAPARYAKASSNTLTDGKSRPLRERMIVLVDLSEEDMYAVTLERVFGGEEHTFSFHGLSGTPLIEGLTLHPQKGGTVAGATILYGNRNAAVKKLNDEELNFLAFLPEPLRGAISGPWSIDIALESQNEVHLRNTFLYPINGELALAMGSAPGGKSAYKYPWTILRRSGQSPLVSEFLNFIEPYEGKRIIRDIKLLDLQEASKGHFQSFGIRVTTDRFTDTIIIQPAGGSMVTAEGIDTDAEFSFLREKNGLSLATVIANGKFLQRNHERSTLNPAAYIGVIEHCNWSNRTIRVKLTGAIPVHGECQNLVGRHIRIIGRPTPPAEAGSDVSYIIDAAGLIEGGLELVLNLDPRIGEAPVLDYADGIVKSGTNFRMAKWNYYAGKHLTNEDGSAGYRLKGIEGGSECIIDVSHGQVPARRLLEEFSDKDGDGVGRLYIYDYGPGDTVVIPNWMAVNNTEQPNGINE